MGLTSLIKTVTPLNWLYAAGVVALIALGTWGYWHVQHIGRDKEIAKQAVETNKSNETYMGIEEGQNEIHNRALSDDAVLNSMSDGSY